MVSEAWFKVCLEERDMVSIADLIEWLAQGGNVLLNGFHCELGLISESGYQNALC